MVHVKLIIVGSNRKPEIPKCVKSVEKSIRTFPVMSMVTMQQKSIKFKVNFSYKHASNLSNAGVLLLAL
jgi:hypothetical protein